MHRLRSAGISSRALIAAAVVLAALFVAHGPVAASTLASVPGVSVTVPAGGSTTILIGALTLSPSGQVPLGPLSAAAPSLATDRVRTSLYYGLDWGYTETAPNQVALAVWYAMDGTWHSSDHTVADRIANAASSAPGLPFWNVSGTSLLSLAAQGQVALAPLALTAAPASSAFGTGALEVRNLAATDLAVYLPYGAVFAGPSGSALIWATAGATTPPAASPTTAPAPATSTPEPSPTTALPTGYKPGYVPPAPPTATTEPAASSVAEATPTAVQQVTEPPVAQEPTSTDGTTQPVAGSQVAAGATGPVAPSAAATGASASQSQPSGSAAAPAVGGIGAAAPASGTQAPPHAARSARAPGPPPVATQGAPASDGQAVPGPVSTAPANVPPPDAEATKQAAIDQKPAPTSTPTTAKSDAAPGVVKTEVPVKVPVAPADAVPKATPAPAPAEPPVINVAPGVQDQSVPAAGSSSGGQGSPPASNPATGGGASPLPVWLALISAIMVLGGWSLRRISAPRLKRAEARNLTQR